jgi:D-alanyl-D-alanine carboxypeptidase/D-alanyl-D-alanine-endopeptidase (penicillin-binding protein 4)
MSATTLRSSPSAARRLATGVLLVVFAIAFDARAEPDPSLPATLALPATTAPPGTSTSTTTTSTSTSTTTTTTTAPPAPAAPAPPGFLDAVRERLGDPRFENATVGLAVWMEGVGDVVTHNADVPLLPGSNEKLLVAWGAYSVLGPANVLTTEVRADGEVDGSTLRGHLILVGGGDPSLRSTGDHSIDSLAAAIRAQGITEVAGDVVADESRFDSDRRAPGWTNFHVPNFVGPVSALAVDSNFLRTDPDYLANPAGGNLQAFREALGRHGVAVAGINRMGTAPPSSTILASIYSPPVGVLVRDMMTLSDNFMAEMLLKEVGYRAFGLGTLQNGVTAAQQTAESVGLTLGGRAADGSGLSRDNARPTTEWLDLLVAARDQPWFGPFVDAMPLAGRTGTLTTRFRGTPSEANLRAKTGSVRGSRALSGYFITAGGRQAAFSLVVNRDPIPPAVLAAMDDLVTAMVAHG